MIDLLDRFGSDLWGLFLHHFAIANDGVQRRAQLVAHAGQELRLGLAGFVSGRSGFFGGLFSAASFLFRAATFGVLLLEPLSCLALLFEHLLAQTRSFASLGSITEGGDGGYPHQSCQCATCGPGRKPAHLAR
jgi:hypothetical protein